LLWRTYNRASSGKSPPETGAEIILKSFELGVNFIDTAELYGTYSISERHLKRQIKISWLQPNPMPILPKEQKKVWKKPERNGY